MFRHPSNQTARLYRKNLNDMRSTSDINVGYEKRLIHKGQMEYLNFKFETFTSYFLGFLVFVYDFQ